jgi:4-amino-4-deoxy-L-arabinose transferase-like glycosyltransferase
MLESLPALTSLLAVVCYTRWKRKRTRNIDGWLVTSALFLGLTAASKYLYCVAGIAILVDWILEAIQAKQLGKSILPVLCWGLVGILIFLIFDPYLWPNPIARLQESIFNNVSYSSNSIEVQKAGYPFWQPLVWLTMSPYIWHPQAFYFAIDPLISALAVFGLPGIWKKQRVFLLWFATSLLFLLLWPTKWPQYIITLTAPLALLAAEGIMTLFVRPISHWVAKRGTK